jgi:hypothetical protein
MKLFFKYILVLFILLQPAITKADPGNGNQNGNGNGGNGNHNGWGGGGGVGGGGVPLDGGISLLVAAGVGYGAKKMAAKKKAAEETEQTK